MTRRPRRVRIGADEEEPMRETVTKQDLQPGDVVDLELEAFGSAVIRQVHEGKVMAWRPYATSDNFTYSGGRVIPYIGVEDFELVGAPKSAIVRVRRSNIPEIVADRKARALGAVS